MQYSLHDHILHLEGRIQELSDQLTRPCEASTREGLESDVQVATLALDYYRKAFQLEQEVALESPRIKPDQTQPLPSSGIP